MGKSLPLLLCLLVLLLGGCSRSETESSSSSSSSSAAASGYESFGTVTADGLTGNGFFSQDLSELKEMILARIPVADDRVSMPPQPRPGAELFFRPDGQMDRVYYSLYGVTQAGSTEYLADHYVFDCTPKGDQVVIDLQQSSEKVHLSRGSAQEDGDSFHAFYDFSEWADSFDMDPFLPDGAEAYALVAGCQLPGDVLEDPGVSCTLYDVSSETPTEIPRENIPWMDPQVDWFCPYSGDASQEGSEARPLVYYLLLSFHQGEDAEGLTPEELFAGPEEDPEANRAWISHCQTALGEGDWRVNRILLLFPNGTGPRQDKDTGSKRGKSAGIIPERGILYI